MSVGSDWVWLRVAGAPGPGPGTTPFAGGLSVGGGSVGAGRAVARSRRADTLWGRFRGLMLSPPLSPGEGLWFPACGAVHTALLRAPIDLLFLRGRTVARVCRVVRPWRIAVCPGADSVVELAAGEVERLGLQPGLQLEISPEPAAQGGETSRRQAPGDRCSRPGPGAA